VKVLLGNVMVRRACLVLVTRVQMEELSALVTLGILVSIPLYCRLVVLIMSRVLQRSRDRNLTQVYSSYPCERLLMKTVFVKMG